MLIGTLALNPAFSTAQLEPATNAHITAHSLSSLTGNTIDVYGGARNSGYEPSSTAFPAPYGGQEPDQPMDTVFPQSEARLYANVTENSSPIPYQDVILSIEGPFETNASGQLVPKESFQVWLNTTVTTDVNGVANLTYVMPWPSVNPEGVTGIWKVVGTSTIVNETVVDTMTFYYERLLRVSGAVTDKYTYGHGEWVRVTVSYQTHSMQTYPAVFLIVLTDELGVPVNMTSRNETVGGAAFPDVKTVSFTVSLFIPKWAFAGVATVDINCYDKASGGFAWCPQYQPSPEIFIAPVAVPNDYASIQDAINSAGVGDTIYVREGIYYENIVVNKTVSLVGENSETTVIDGGQNGRAVVSVYARRAGISGFTIRNGWSNGTALVAGISVYSAASSFNISSNQVVSNDYGVFVNGTSYGIVSGNNVTGNSRFGVYLTGSSVGNKLYHNNILDNGQQTYAGSSVNAWDNGYPSGGNCWSDYIGTDLYGGLGQNETGKDGLGDAPYVINENNTDRYPLVKAYGGPHDVAMISLVPSKTIVGEGYGLNVTFEAVNIGEQTETFNVTIMANLTVTRTEEVTLLPRKIVSVSFEWNTSGVVRGNYSLSAVADAVKGETSLGDNSLVNGWVFVSIVGDVNADGKVDVRDVYAVALAFGSTLGFPLYAANLDINDDGKIDIRDYYRVCFNYGRQG